MAAVGQQGQSPVVVIEIFCLADLVIYQLALFICCWLTPLLDKWYLLRVTWEVRTVTSEKFMYELLPMVAFPYFRSLWGHFKVLLLVKVGFISSL